MRREKAMISRFVFALASVALCGVSVAWPDDIAWHGVEIVKFTDFDDVLVKLDGKETKAFLAGLRPLRETIKEKEQLECLRAEITAKLRKNALSARILTKKNAEVVGLSVDAFMHHKNDFDHPWNPNRIRTAGPVGVHTISTPISCGRGPRRSWTGWEIVKTTNTTGSLSERLSRRLRLKRRSSTSAAEPITPADGGRDPDSSGFNGSLGAAAAAELGR